MKSEKIVYDFIPKVNYDIYAPALKFLIQNDMVTLDKLIDYIPCEADYVMAPFIVAMTERRIEAQKMINKGKELLKNEQTKEEGKKMIRKGETLKEFYKLLNNSAYGKTIQNDEKFHRTILTTSAADNQKYLNNYIITDCKVVSQPDKSYKENDEGMSQISALNPRVKIKAPKHMGAAILWNSKIVIFDFIYNCLMKYCKETEFYYTDTDSVHIKMKLVEAPKKFVDEIRNKFTCDDRLAIAIASLYARFPEEIRAKYFPSDKDDIIAGKMKVDQIFFEGGEGVYLKAKTYIEGNEEDGKMKTKKVRDKGVSLKQNSSSLIIEEFKMFYTIAKLSWVKI